MTPQEACGVKIGSGVSKDQAFCIAKQVGLAEGLEPWEAGVEPAQPGEKSSRWVVTNRESQEACPSDNIWGTSMVIDMRDGSVRVTYKAMVLCCPGP
jgi:hypothetical protein